MFHSTTSRTVTAALIALGCFACNRGDDQGEGTGRGPGDEAAHSRATDVSVNDGPRRASDADQVFGQSDVVTNPGNGGGGGGSGAAGSGSGGRTPSGGGGTNARP